MGILPLFSQDKTSKGIDAEKIPDLDIRVQDAGTEVVNAKSGKGSATLSMAYAGARLGKAVLDGLEGKGTVECAKGIVDACATHCPNAVLGLIVNPVNSV